MKKLAYWVLTGAVCLLLASPAVAQKGESGGHGKGKASTMHPDNDKDKSEAGTSKTMPARSNKGGAERGQARAAEVHQMNATSTKHTGTTHKGVSKASEKTETGMSKGKSGTAHGKGKGKSATAPKTTKS